MGSPSTEPSFLDATKRLKKTVLVGGEPFVVETFGLLRGFIFERLKTKFVGCRDGDYTDKASTINEMLGLLLDDRINGLRIDEVLGAVVAVLEVNPEFPLLAWQTVDKVDEYGKLKKDLIELDLNIDLYEGRYLAKIVSLLSSTFGWTPHYILNELTSYEVAFYVQEAMIVVHDKQEWEYTLSDIGVEKVGDDYKKKPFPILTWVTKVPKATSDKTREKIDPHYLPDGHIIDLTNLEQMRQMGLYDKFFKDTVEGRRRPDDVVKEDKDDRSTLTKLTLSRDSTPENERKD